MRNVWTKVGLVLAICVSPITVASTVEPAPSPDMAKARAQAQAWQSRIVQLLTEQGSADTLTTAALMLPESVTLYDGSLTEPQRKAAANKLDTRRLQLLDRAGVLAPDAADIATLALQVCTRVAGCDVAEHAEHLHQAAPDDAGYLMPALADARSRQDKDEVSSILQSMADAATFKTWYPALRQRVQRGIAAIAVPASPAPIPAEFSQRHPDVDAATMAAITAGSMMFAVAGMPEYGTLVQACKEDGVQFSARQQACRRIGKMLSHDHSLIGVRIGLVLWRQSALDPADLKAATDTDRTLDWQQESWTQLMLRDKVDPLESYQETLDNGGEIPGVIALLKKHGVATQPPAGWVSDREQARQARQTNTEAAPESGECAGTP